MTIRNTPYGDMPSHRISANQANKTGSNNAIQTGSFSDKLEKAKRSAKTDTIELSKRSAKPTLSQIRDNLLSDLSKDKDINFIEDLRSQLESGQYSIDPKDLASYLLSEN